MIIARTPFRISFFGGGTDYAAWYQEHGGAVLSTTINHYCYLTARWLPPFFPEKTRVVWSKIEQVLDHEDIQHPSVKAILQFLNINNGVELHHTGDLPARSGLGSSSSFTVGLLHALRSLKGEYPHKFWLANDAVTIEREILRENVGIQDQIAAAYGGYNHTTIDTNGNFDVKPVAFNEELQNHLLLFFTGVSRTASDIAKDVIANTGNKQSELKRMQEMVDEALKITDIDDFGRLLHESWSIKRTLSAGVAPQFVDDIYAKGREAGALGGKLLGAGGGGFMLFFAKPELHDSVRNALKDLLWVPFKFENEGSQIIFNQANSYSRESLKRRDYVLQR